MAPQEKKQLPRCGQTLLQAFQMSEETTIISIPRCVGVIRLLLIRFCRYSRCLANRCAVYVRMAVVVETPRSSGFPRIGLVVVTVEKRLVCLRQCMGIAVGISSCGHLRPRGHASHSVIWLFGVATLCFSEQAGIFGSVDIQSGKAGDTKHFHPSGQAHGLGLRWLLLLQLLVTYSTYSGTGTSTSTNISTSTPHPSP